MRVTCDICKKFITKIDVKIDPITNNTDIVVHCHGATDSMQLTQEWMADNQDFVQMINYDMIVGTAFKNT